MSRLTVTRSFLGRHRLFAAAFGLGLVVRLITMLGFPPAIWFGGDSASYLSTALYHAPGTSRLSGYGFVLFLLKPFHSFAVVTAVQHLMGLAVGVMIYALLRRYGLPGWGATLAALPVLLDAYQIELEHEILPSATFGFLVMVAITLTLWWRRDRPLWATVAAGIRAGRRGHPVAGRAAGADRVPAVPGGAPGGLAGVRGGRGRGGDPARRLRAVVPRPLRPVRLQQQRRHLPVVADDDVRQLRRHPAARGRTGPVPAPAGGAAAGRVHLHLGEELAAEQRAGPEVLGPQERAGAALRAAGDRRPAGQLPRGRAA